jgi:hypothetical protein
MADISQYLFLWNEVATLTGTVNSDSDWVYINATLSISPTMFPYGRGTTFTADGIQFPGHIIPPYSTFEAGIGGLPYLFCRLPNPPYGAKIIAVDNDTAPNAMTELDSANVGVEANPDFGMTGKYLGSQVRSSWVHKISGTSLPRPVDNEVDFPPEVWSVEKNTYPNAIRRQYFYDTYFTEYVLAEDEEGHPIPGEWIEHDPVPLVWDPNDTDQRVISRGGWTYLGFFGKPSPGMVMDFDMQWWNGDGFICPHLSTMSWV